jgi:response regulator RpfG family c-di-GMP phosphodiesterase
MEVLERLRDEDNDVPVVIVTAHGSVADAVRAMKLGAIDFIAKPITPELLRRVVRDVLDRHAPSDREFASESAKPQTTVVLAPALIDLTQVKLALNRRQFDQAERLLWDILDLAPDSVEANNLLGVLQESRGQQHAAYHSYRTSLELDPHYQPALDNLKRYCERFGLDFSSLAINPAAAH